MAVPYGVYEIGADPRSVSLGIEYATAEFANLLQSARRPSILPRLSRHRPPRATRNAAPIAAL
jgi:hypothetical protein